MDEVRLNEILDMLWDAAERAGLQEDDSKEEYLTAAKASVAAEGDGFPRMLEEFGKLYTASVAAEYERKIEELEERIERASSY